MKQKLDKNKVEKIAKLANLDLTEVELRKFTAQLEEVIDYNVLQLSQVNTDQVEPLLNVSGLTNATREDEAIPSLTQVEALKNTKDSYNGFFKVKQILDQG